jgi:hypothetical protein
MQLVVRQVPGTEIPVLVMPRFQTDDKFDSDPAVLRAGTAAMGLYYRCGIYVAGQLLDGLVPSEIAAQYGTPEWVKRLTDAALWEPVQGGYYMPLYFAHKNPTRAKVLAEREAAAARQERWLEKKRERNRSSAQRRINNASHNASKDASVTPSVTRPIPPSFQEGSGPDGRASPAGSPDRAAEEPPATPAQVRRSSTPEGMAAAVTAARHAIAAKRRPP